MLEYDSFVKRACGVWMRDNGVDKSFTKRFTVEAPPYSLMSIITLGFRKSGQPLLEVENCDEYIGRSALVVYEPNLEYFDDIGIYATTESFAVNSYMETLVLLG
ncbi:unnamed protein product [Lactuca saligna]|uniref:Uncharacterized protein n=1 Tax=Lactuca saligna TaxID=75948 RepID=A0AA35V7F4_LACSI|nr:unnamed protein product [Lactuca saligna]